MKRDGGSGDLEGVRERRGGEGGGEVGREGAWGGVLHGDRL